MSFYRVMTQRFTCGVETGEDGVIIKTAPILRKFKGQNIQNLKNWLVYIHGAIEEIY